MKTRNKLIIWIITAAVILTSLSVFALSAAAEEVGVSAPQRSTEDIYSNGNAVTIEAVGDKTVVWYMESGVKKYANPSGADGDDLSKFEIFGGYGYGDDSSIIFTGNTSVTMLSGTVKSIYGGGDMSTVNGDTNVVISGGTVGNVYGGGHHGSVNGTTNISISGGTVADVIGGGVRNSTVENTNISITGGTFSGEYGVLGAGFNNSTTVTGNTKITISGDAKINQGVYGGGWNGVTNGSSTVIVSGGTVEGNVKASGVNSGATVDSSLLINKTTGTVVGNYTLTDDLTISTGTTLTIPEDASMTIAKDTKITIAEGATLANNGTVVNNGEMVNNGNMSFMVSLDKTDFYFSNSPVAPAVTVTAELDGEPYTLKEDTDYELEYANNKEAGTATVTVTGKGNFKGAITMPFTIKYLESPLLSEFVSDGYSSGGVYWFKDGESAEVSAPGYNGISTTLDGPYVESVTFGANDEKKVYLRKTLSDPGNVNSVAITDAIDLSAILNWDSTAPTGEITLSPEIDVKSRWDGIDFKWFFESAQTLAVVAEDAESGIKSVEYYISNGKIDNMASIEEWKTYDEINRITLDKDGKYVVYVKITDNVGNVTYENTDGIVIFSDSTLNTANINTDYKSTEEDQKISISLNGNTVNSVMVGGDELTKDTEYSVLDNGDISLKASYLNTLNAGQYTVTVMYNPQGEIHVVNERNDSPAVTMMRLTVAKADPKYEIPTGLKAYHGQTRDDVALPIVPNGEWEWSVDPAVSTDLIGVGKKFVKANFIPNDQANYNNVYNVNITIEVLPITVIPPMADRTVFVYNGEEQTYGIANTSVYKVEGNVKTLAGEYTVTIALIDKVNYVWPDGTTDDLEYEFVIERAPSVITAAPKANKLTYNGSLQALASEGSVIGGKLVYGLSSSSLKAPTEWHAEIPAVTNAGIYYVWYKVIGNELYKDAAPKQVRAVLEAKTVDIVWSDTEFAYDGEYHKPTATLVGVLDGDECEAEISGLRKTLGWHTARVVALSDPNYVVVENESVSFTISDSDGVYEAEIKAREEERAETKAEIKAEAEKTANTIVNAIVSVVKKALVSLVRNIFAR